MNPSGGIVGIGTSVPSAGKMLFNAEAQRSQSNRRENQEMPLFLVFSALISAISAPLR
jgi:hypothetical protein